MRGVDLPCLLAPDRDALMAAADERFDTVQSGISNHRAALWSQVRTAFRQNIDETDEAKVCML